MLFWKKMDNRNKCWSKFMILLIYTYKIILTEFRKIKKLLK